MICIGNSSNKRIKVQFTTREGCEKYEIRTEPQIISLKKDEACEFEVFIKPLCSCKMEDQLMIVCQQIKSFKEIVKSIKLEVETEISTRLDPDELTQEKKFIMKHWNMQKNCF